MDPFLGQIIFFAGNFAPRGWAFCHGQLLPIASNQALFAILGTIYGGDGRTTFALPDLRGRAPVSEGTGPGLSSISIGQKGGTEQVTLNVTNLPSHNHSIILKASGDPGTTTSPADSYLAESGRGDNDFTPSGANLVNLQGGGMTTNTGGSQPVYTRAPYLAINSIIALQGTFPSRN
ncbi:phage tail protein [Neolewinella aurantiaca]|uniref:Phage tail protein n=1 Tax=Neolewinella aurantiaca TaxID=2602767 RepID=A0A5C7FUG9_9BACT|nr:tail fiber protein [Neolewinella aurantiaca]TXF89964.1 phage tail protein [Neolewinella aurantiaca]